MILATMTSESYTWTAFGETVQDAAAALQAAFDIHVERANQAGDYLEPIADVADWYGTNYLTIDPTVVYRDDSAIKIKED